ncbi:hypothetical protein CI102_1736 [Trichoderma harzianum]|nr:hypothetical protein CI102_1736 [Trichoderma harzianum]
MLKWIRVQSGSSCKINLNSNVFPFLFLLMRVHGIRSMQYYRSATPNTCMHHMHF